MILPTRSRLYVPGAYWVAHGQLSGEELEDVMVRFVEGDYDVLVATTIIESGLDIANRQYHYHQQRPYDPG